MFKELKSDYKALQYNSSIGQAALNIFVYEIDNAGTKEKFLSYTKKPIYVDWQFILCEYDLLINHILNSKMRKDERYKIFTIVYNFYVIQLEYSINNMSPQLKKFEVDMDSYNMIEKFRKSHKTFLESKN